MRNKAISELAICQPRALLACTFLVAGVLLGVISLGAANSPRTISTANEATGPGWSIVSAVTPSYYEAIVDLTCVSEADCWAVGRRGESTSPDLKTLIRHWNGVSWSIVPSVDVGIASRLLGVTCNSSTDCWAVGYYRSVAQAPPQNLIEHWDGHSWTIVPSPNRGTGQNSLAGVTCTSAQACWAVGFATDALILRWDGIQWEIATSPDSAGKYAELSDVTCTSASNCWAVGDMQVDCDDEFDRCLTQTLIQHWDGTVWTIVPSPNVSTGEHTFLIAVRCPSDSQCWSVGIGQNYGENQNLIQRWDGNSWTIVPSPNLSATGWNQLFDLDCVSPNDCWAVGNYAVVTVPPPYPTFTLTLHWDGSTWTTVPSPNGSESTNGLGSIDCTSSSRCWAGGGGYSANNSPLFELYSPTVPPLISVGSRKIHGNTTFDLDLLGDNGVECRIPGATGTAGVDHKVVFSFINDVANCGEPTIGSVTAGPEPNQCTVNLAGIGNQQRLTIGLDNVLDVQSNTGNVAKTMGFLIGDANGSGVVTSGDTNLCKAQALQPLTIGNFRDDTNASGSITSGDSNLIKQHALEQLPR